MAEIVLGLTNSAIERAVNRVESAMEEDMMLKAWVQNDLVSISGEFQIIMQSFLAPSKVGVVRTWVRQVHDLAYDLEDRVELVVQLDKFIEWWWRLAPSWCSPAGRPLDEVVREIKKLNARAEDLSQGNMRYSLVKDSASKPVPPMKPATAPMAGFNVLNEVRKAVRKQGSTGDLADLIASQDNCPDLQVISLWGTGGDLGITSTIKKAYDDPEICDKFTSRAWSKIMHPFNPNEFMSSLLSQLCGNSQQRDVRARMKAATATDSNVLKDLMQQVNGQRYLIVLQDLATVVEWYAIRMYLPDCKNGSRIIVSAPQFEVASLCTGQPHQVSQLRQLSANHYVCAFFKQCDGHKGKQDIDEISGDGDVIPRHLYSWDNVRTTKMKEANTWSKNIKLLGREREVGELHKLISGLGDTQVTFVWGIAGVGKSALVRSVYCSYIVSDYVDMECVLSWVDAPNPFNLTEFSWRLFLGFHAISHQSKEAAIAVMTGSKDPIQECCKILKECRRCLIVIDGLRSMEEWKLIKAVFFTENNANCSIVVITNKDSIAAHSAEARKTVFNVTALEADAALELFKKEIGWGQHNIPDMMQHRELILTKCGGFPRVIADAGRYLANQTSSTAWTSLSVGFMDILETDRGFDSSRDVLTCMHSNLVTCPDILKPCIFYLPVFPANHSIRRSRLVRRWIAEGYCRNTDVISEKNGERYFSMLVDFGMIQQKPRTSKGMVNGFFYEYIISRQMEDNLVIELEGSCSLNLQRTVRHLAIRSSWDRDINLYKSIDFSRLRSLTVFGKWESFFISAKIKMRLLRVLDLEDTSGVTDDDLEQIIKLVPRLKFLSLRGCNKISHLLISFGGLRHLQTLDVRHTSIVKLPPTITRLHRLQYIRASATISSDDANGIVASLPTTDGNQKSIPSRRMTCTSMFGSFNISRSQPDNCGVEVPRGIGKLTSLHTLGVINVNVTGGEAILKELRNLTHLRKLGVSGINHKNCKTFCSVVSHHLQLESLSVHLDQEKECTLCYLDDTEQPLKALQSFKLYGQVDKLPRQFNNIKKLSLEITILTQEYINFLLSIRHLEILRLCVKPTQDRELHFCLEPGYSGFISLEILEIACSSRLQVTFGGGVFKCLNLLKVHCCSETSICGLEHLSQLKEVLLWGSYDNALSEGVQRQLAMHPSRPVLKLERN